MIEQKFLVENPETLRLDLFIKERIKQLSRAQIQRAIKKGRVLVNGKTVKASHKLKKGDLVEFSYQEYPQPADIKPENIDFETIYEDNQILVINKPSGLVVHPGAGVRKGTLVNGLIFRYPEITGVGSEVRPGIVHRLDKETSGLMVIARSPAAYQSLRRQFEDRTVKKTYLALAQGRFRAKKGIIDLPVGRHVHYREKMSVRTRKPRIAVTHFEVLEEFKETTFLALRPVTGRTHQLRVHLSATGHPLAGDTRYGGSDQRQREKYPRLFLHASRLSFEHPTKGEKLEFECSLPAELQIVLKRERQQK
jgi:23S rRNA pseudouridine1911/1915/1917 synthase